MPMPMPIMMRMMVTVIEKACKGQLLGAKLPPSLPYRPQTTTTTTTTKAGAVLVLVLAARACPAWPFGPEG